MAQVTLRKVVKMYDEVQAVRGIDLDITDKEFIVLVGPSGCGKSTTLRMIAGLEEISGGDIAIGGATLAAEAAALGLIDEYRAMVYPVLVGGGIPFFPRRERRVDLDLVETRTFSSRVVYLRYRVAR